jgi:hypothetical protein
MSIQFCINQPNQAERSHQVGFMRNIYEDADMVLACLGENPSDGRWVEAAKRLDFEELISVSDLELEDWMLRVGERVFVDFHDEDFRRDWASMGDLLQSTWWKGGWICQEATVAQHILVLFGRGIRD